VIGTARPTRSASQIIDFNFVICSALLGGLWVSLNWIGPERITRFYGFGLASTARNPIPQRTGIFSFAFVISEPCTQALYHSAKEVQALAVIIRKIDKVLVWRRLRDQGATSTPMVAGRDYDLREVMKGFAGRKVAPVSMPAEAPLFLMYTSGTTGRPKGCQHSTGGYLAYVAGTSNYIQDIHPEDIYWCMADIGWITGHSYIVYGPLALAATSVIYEGVPTYPDAGRAWRIAERLNVNIFHTSPTVIRMLRKAGPDEPSKYNHHFKYMTTVGEPIEPDVWRWLVLQRGRQAGSCDRRYLVANRKRGFSVQYQAGAGSHEAWQHRSRGAGDVSRDLGRRWERSPGGLRPGRKHLHPQPVAGNLPNHLGRSRAVRKYLLPQILQGPEKQGLARLEECGHDLLVDAVAAEL
jgi:AMP-binding enzyme